MPDLASDFFAEWGLFQNHDSRWKAKACIYHPIVGSEILCTIYFFGVRLILEQGGDQD